MKFFIALLTVIVLKTCNDIKVKETAKTTATTAYTKMPPKQQQKSNSISLQYTEETRGAFRQVTVNKDSIYYQLERDGMVKTTPISAKKWNGLLGILEKIDVKTLSQLKAPSNKKATDAALMARLKVTKDDSIYSTPDFDHDNPIAEVKPLVTNLIELGHLRK